MGFKARYRIYWSETDSAGIAHFTSILRIVERAEEDLYRAHGVGDIHRLLPRVEVHARYMSILRWGDEIEVELLLDEARRRGVRYRFEITNITTNRKAAEGYIAFACVEKKYGEIEAIECPKELIEIWRKT